MAVSDMWGGDVQQDVTRLDGLVRETSAEQGLVTCAEFIKVHPDRGEGFFYAGLINHGMSELGQAMEMMQRAHELDPDVREYALALASLYAKSNQLNDALYFAKIAAANEPDDFLDHMLPDDLRDFIASTLSADPQKHHVQAMIAFNLRNFTLAVHACEQELKLNPRFVPAYALIAKALVQLGHFERAAMAFLAVLELGREQPDVPVDDDVRTGLAECYLRLGQVQDARAVLDSVMARDRVDADTLAAVVRLLDLVCERDWLDVRAACRAWSRQLWAGIDPYFPPKPRPDDRIRVGFLTDKAYRCLEGELLEGIAKRYDRNLFDCFLYIQNINPDALTHGFAGTMTGVRTVFEIDDKTLALIIQRDAIDVLVDMCGYGAGQRLNLVAHRPACSHVSWLAAPAWDDQPGIDWCWRDTADTRVNSAPAVRIPLAFEAMIGFGPLTALPARDHGTVTFGARLDLSYITVEIAGLWGRLLQAVPGARLRLGLVSVVSPAMVDRLAEVMAPFDVSERIVLDTPDEDEAPERGRFFKDVDIFLGQPTGDAVNDFVEALWCGVPCLSVPPDRPAFVTGRDVVRLCGQDDWNSSDGADLVKMGTALAADLAALGAVRADLREIVRCSALMDADGFTVQLQSLLVTTVQGTRDRGEPGQ